MVPGFEFIDQRTMRTTCFKLLPSVTTKSQVVQKNKTCFEKLNRIQKRSVVNKCQKVNEQTNKQQEKQNKSQKGGQKQIEKKKHQGKCLSYLRSVFECTLFCQGTLKPGFGTSIQHVARPAPVPPHSSQLASIMANFQSIWQALAGTGFLIFLLQVPKNFDPS